MKYLNPIIAAVLVFSLLIWANCTTQGLNTVKNYGWAPETKPERKPLLKNIQVPSGRGEVRLLYEDWQKATGYAYAPRNQGPIDCVGQSAATGADFRMAVQVVEGVYQVPEYTVSAPPIYGLSRIEIAGKAPTAKAGSRVRYAMRAMSEYGLLFRKNYLYAGYDLTDYDQSKSHIWGSQGLPSVLEDVAKLTPMVSYYKVTNYAQVRDAIAAGYPVVVGSKIGFSRRNIFSWGRTKATRDRNGFLRRQGSWNHAMCFIGVDDKSSRKGVCCLNSWGSSWVSGPTKLGQPAGSFWIDAKTVTDMVKQGDSFAIVHINSPLSYRLVK